jgi:hypothetical protein
MSLFVEVYVGSKDNRTLVAESIAHNVSNLADTSDYKFTTTEYGNLSLGIAPSVMVSEIKGHKRKQSVWNLVAKMIKDYQE